MPPIAFHVMLRTEERRVLAPSVGLRRALASAVHEIAGSAGLLAFRGSDTHAPTCSSVPTAPRPDEPPRRCHARSGPTSASGRRSSPPE
jgi:hypothetical protein